MFKGAFCCCLLLFAANVFAEIEPYSCRNGAFPGYENLALGQIVAAKGEKVHARDDGKGCPQADKCRQKGYLINGDRVLVKPAQQGWVCSYYLGKKNDYTGYITQGKVRLVQYAATPAPSAWAGKWRSLGGRFANKIAITTTQNGQLQVEGRAFWYGGKTPDGNSDIVHFGGVSGKAAATGNRLTISEGSDKYSCVAHLRLLGSLLVVNDNGNCGGMNVRFDAVYRKAGR